VRFDGYLERYESNPPGRVVVLDINPLGAVGAAGDEFFEMLGSKPNLAMINPNVRYPSQRGTVRAGNGVLFRGTLLHLRGIAARQ
jgi:hypothetical protein